MEREIRVRFAPSPTGPLHIGGARSALFNWLYARGRGGKMVLRVEDTDTERSSRESEEEIVESLRWLGLNWDEGVGPGGPGGPYRQGERLHIYGPYVERLLREGRAYHCFCSPEELEAERQEMLRKGETPRHQGPCLTLTEEVVKGRLARGEKAAVRFRVPGGRQVVIHDLVRGEVAFETDGIGDFIIIKSDGLPTYNFAVVVDDLEMGITHVIRAEEHLSNTPRQVLIYEALEAELPEFAHISLILGEDRAKMSKRHGATSIVQYRRMGYLPEALVNFLALLGWSPEDEEEFFTLEELVRAFSLERVTRSPAVFNIEKLNWMNANYLRKLPPQELVRLSLPHLREAGFAAGELSPGREEWLAEALVSVQSKVEYLSQIPRQAGVYFGRVKDPENAETIAVLREGRQVLQELLKRVEAVEPWEEGTIKDALKALGKDLKVKGKSLFMPVRAAVSGQLWGPELPTMVRLLGREGVKERIAHSLKWAEGEGAGEE